MLTECALFVRISFTSTDDDDDDDDTAYGLVIYLSMYKYMSRYLLCFFYLLCFYFCFHLFLKVPRDRTRHRIARPVQRTTTATAEVSSVEDTSPFSSTESYASKANRRRKFRPEFKSTTTTSNYEEGKNDDGDVKK